MKHAARALLAVGATALIVGCASGTPQASKPLSKPPSKPVHVIKPVTGLCGVSKPLDLQHYFGVIDGPPGSTQYNRFMRRSGVRPTLADYFWNFGAKFNPDALCYAENHRAMPVIQFNLRHLTAAQVAAGQGTRYITHLAQGIKAFALPVVISLGHEMNGNWYPWGWHRTPATTFVAMWRRVHQDFANVRAKNVIWMWTVNRAVPPATNPGPWWPGSAYVNWVGIDGHSRQVTDSFGRVFNSTIADVRALTTDPILISETAVVASPQRPAQLAALFRAVYQTPGLIGIVYLDMRNVRIDWRLRDTASINAFSKAVQPYEPATHG